MVKRHVGLIKHLLLCNAFLPCANGMFQNIKLTLIPASILGTIALGAPLKDASEELTCAALGLPSAFEEFQEGLTTLKALTFGKTDPVLVKAC